MSILEDTSLKIHYWILFQIGDINYISKYPLSLSMQELFTNSSILDKWCYRYYIGWSLKANICSELIFATRQLPMSIKICKLRAQIHQTKFLHTCDIHHSYTSPDKYLVPIGRKNFLFKTLQILCDIYFRASKIFIISRSDILYRFTISQLRSNRDRYATSQYFLYAFVTTVYFSRFLYLTSCMCILYTYIFFIIFIFSIIDRLSLYFWQLSTYN